MAGVGYDDLPVTASIVLSTLNDSQVFRTEQYSVLIHLSFPYEKKKLVRELMTHG